MADDGRITLAVAGRRLGADPYYLCGLAKGLRLKLGRRAGSSPRSYTLAAADFERLRARLDDRLGGRRSRLGDPGATLRRPSQ